MSCFKKLLEYNLSDTELEEDPVHLWHRIVERTVHPSTTLWLLTRGKRGRGRPLKRPAPSPPLVASLLAVKCDSHAPLPPSIHRFVPPSLATPLHLENILTRSPQPPPQTQSNPAERTKSHSTRLLSELWLKQCRTYKLETQNSFRCCICEHHIRSKTFLLKPNSWINFALPPNQGTSAQEARDASHVVWPPRRRR